MIYDVIFTDTAKQDLASIAAYITKESKDKQSSKEFISKLINRCKKLQDFPYAGSTPNDYFLMLLGHKFVAYNGYLIFYSVDEENKRVIILSVLNEKMDYIKVMKKIFS